MADDEMDLPVHKGVLVVDVIQTIADERVEALGTSGSNATTTPV